MPSASLHKGLIVYSFTLVAVLFWLSVSFLANAFSEKRDSEFLKYYLEADQKFKTASLITAQEESASYWLIAFENLLFNPTASLTVPYENTQEALSGLQSKNDEIVALPKYADELKFRRGQLQDLTQRLNHNIEKLPEIRALLASTLDTPIEQREENQQRKILNYYSNLVEQIEMLRSASTYVSRRQSRAIQNLLVVSNATWNLGLSNEFISALFGSYLTTGKLISGEAINRASYHVNQLKDNFDSISLIDSYASIDPEFIKLVNEFRDWYASLYEPQLNAISIAMAENGEVEVSSYDWRQLYLTMADYTAKIQNRADQITDQRVIEAERKASANYIVDILLVLSCILFATASIWFVKRVQHQATHDVLTGLSNRRLFVTKCENLVSPESNDSIALIKVDLCKFKTINDSIGQFAGDELLQQVAERLRASFCQASLISRLGSDEFAILLKGFNHHEVNQIAVQVVNELSGQYQLQSHTVSLKTCVGFASTPVDAKTSGDLIKAADLAMHEAKLKGPGNAIHFDLSIADAYKERQELESELEFALQRDEFELYYQPQVDVEKQVVDGVEALIRWRHPTRGIVSPFHFIPIAEDAGLLPVIGDWVINEASKQAGIWKKDFDLDLRVSVNVSAHQFVEGDLVETVRLALARDKLNPSNFEIEITESVAMFDVNTVVSKLNELHKAGVRIALDDFGTGYSSLSYLQDLPLNTLKIDRSFVTKLDDGSTYQKNLLESIALMAKRLDLHTVAEGVETDSQLEQICALGIDTIQGYYYSKPVSASDLPYDVKAIDAACSLSKAA